MSDGAWMVVAFRMAASPFKTHAVVQLNCFLLSWPNALVVGPEVQSLSAPHIVPYARLFLSRWIHVTHGDAASVLSAFTPISKQALCFPSSCPDSVLVHGSLCSLAKYLSVAVETCDCCESQLAERLTRMGRNR